MFSTSLEFEPLAGYSQNPLLLLSPEDDPTIDERDWKNITRARIVITKMTAYISAMSKPCLVANEEQSEPLPSADHLGHDDPDE